LSYAAFFLKASAKIVHFFLYPKQMDKKVPRLYLFLAILLLDVYRLLLFSGHYKIKLLFVQIGFGYFYGYLVAQLVLFVIPAPHQAVVFIIESIIIIVQIANRNHSLAFIFN